MLWSPGAINTRAPSVYRPVPDIKFQDINVPGIEPRRIRALVGAINQRERGENTLLYQCRKPLLRRAREEGSQIGQLLKRLPRRVFIWAHKSVGFRIRGNLQVLKVPRSGYLGGFVGIITHYPTSLTRDTLRAFAQYAETGILVGVT